MMGLFSGGRLRRQEFTESGIWVPPSGLTVVERVIIQSGGGGGGRGGILITASRASFSGGGGGAGGATAMYEFVPVTGEVEIVIGAGGLGASEHPSSANASPGGNSAFSDLIVPGGGSGGNGESKWSSSGTLTAAKGGLGGLSLRGSWSDGVLGTVIEFSDAFAQAQALSYLNCRVLAGGKGNAGSSPTLDSDVNYPTNQGTNGGKGGNSFGGIGGLGGGGAHPTFAHPGYGFGAGGGGGRSAESEGGYPYTAGENGNPGRVIVFWRE